MRKGSAAPRPLHFLHSHTPPFLVSRNRSRLDSSENPHPLYASTVFECTLTTTMVHSPLDSSLEIVGDVASWVEDSQYLFFGLVSTTWRGAWRRPPLTTPVTPHTSAGQLAHCFECGLQRTNEVCSSAAYLGRLDLLQFCVAEGCPWDADTCGKAAAGGNLDVIRWAHANGCPWSAKTCLNAAERGHLAILQWARERGCPCVDEKLCYLAAKGGHLEVVRWIQKSIPWYFRRTPSTCNGAAAGGKLGFLQWAKSEVRTSWASAAVVRWRSLNCYVYLPVIC